MNVRTLVLNGWAASPHAWDLCRFARTCLFSYVEQLDGEPEKAIENVERCILVGWSMGGSSALRLACRFPERLAGLVLVPLVSLLTKAPPKDQVDQLFASYDRKVTVRARDSIEVSEN